MILRRAGDFRSRLMIAVAIGLTIVLLSLVLMVTPVQAITLQTENGVVRAEELQGFLTTEGDIHFLGLEAEEGAESILLTLSYRAPEDALRFDSVNFAVLAADGLQAYLGGAPLDAAAVTGSMLVANADGTIAQAQFPVVADGGMTVVVSNSWPAPIHYSLLAHGGLLVDDGGQTLLDVQMQPVEIGPIEIVETQPLPLIPVPAPVAEVVSLQPAQKETLIDAVGGFDTTSGLLEPQGDRNYYNLQPESLDGEIIVRLTYQAEAVNARDGSINFWVLTQEGLQHVLRGALPLELNLATGVASDRSAPNERIAEIRLGGVDAYSLIVFNESVAAAYYEVEVDGAVLQDLDYATMAAAAEYELANPAISPSVSTAGAELALYETE